MHNSVKRGRNRAREDKYQLAAKVYGICDDDEIYNSNARMFFHLFSTISAQEDERRLRLDFEHSSSYECSSVAKMTHCTKYAGFFRLHNSSFSAVAVVGSRLMTTESVV